MGLLLEYGADPNKKGTLLRPLEIRSFFYLYHVCKINHIVDFFLVYSDLNGSVPLGEAILGGHESVIKLLKDNGGDLSCSDAGHLACLAVEQNNLELLKEIVKYGGDVTQPKRSNGITALHMAVCDGNIEIVKLLVQQGADIDKPDNLGWTPRTLADHQGHEDIIEMFQNIKDGKAPQSVPTTLNYGNKFLKKFPSEPATRSPQAVTGLENFPRRRANHFHNSIFGIMSAAASRGMYVLFLVLNIYILCFHNLIKDDG